MNYTKESSQNPLRERGSVSQLLTLIRNIAKERIAQIEERQFHPFYDSTENRNARGIVIYLEQRQGEMPSIRFYSTGKYRVGFRNFDDKEILFQIH